MMVQAGYDNLCEKDFQVSIDTYVGKKPSYFFPVTALILAGCASASIKSRPVLFVDRIKNKTSEHIDTESITDTISTRLLRSGIFRFVDMTKVDDVYKQLDFQTDSGLVDPKTAVKIGKQIGAQYMLYGNLSSIVKRSDDKKDVYY